MSDSVLQRQPLLIWSIIAALLFLVSCAESPKDPSPLGTGSDVFDDATNPMEECEAQINTRRMIAGKDLVPRIHSIGASRILTFEKPRANDPTDDGYTGLQIVVEGRDLGYDKCIGVGVKVGGTVDALLSRKDFKRSKLEDGTGAFTIDIKNRYLERVQSGDRLDVTVIVNTLPELGAKPNCRVITYATRHFTLYTVDDYRAQVQASRVPAPDIRAFPLPEAEAEILFGPVVARNFFAVRLSVRNTTDDDKLISTGMITASGRILVEPKNARNCWKSVPSFTIPVELTPQSLEHVYTMVDDEEVNQPRAIVFRTLEFIGALAASASSAFGGSHDLASGIGLFTGVAIPEGQRLWSDRWPGYERNVVAFSMPDLFKVPKGSVAGHKYIFFSKKKLEGIIADQNFFGEFGERAEQPDLSVVEVGFNQLEVPFENVFSVAESTLQEQVAALRVDLPRAIHDLELIQAAWRGRDSDLLFGTLRPGALDEIAAALATAAIKIDERRVAAESTGGDFATKRRNALTSLKAVRDTAKALSQSLTEFPVEASDLDSNTLQAITNAVTTPPVALVGKGAADDPFATASTAVQAFAASAHTHSSDRLSLVERALPRLEEELAESNRALEKIKALEEGDSTADVKAVRKLVSTRLTSVDNAVFEITGLVEEARTGLAVLAQHLAELQSVARNLTPDSITLKLINNPDYGLTRLRSDDRSLRDIYRRIARGGGTSGVAERVEAMRTTHRQVRMALDFYRLSAELLKGGKTGDLGRVLVDVAAGKPADVSDIDTLTDQMGQTYTLSLRQAHSGLTIIPALTSN